jgi:hypothetical protein
MPADIGTTLASWVSTSGSNQPQGNTSVGSNLDDNIRELIGVIVRGLSHKGADIASATTTDIGAIEGLMHDITGTTTITSFGTVRAGIWKILKFEGALTLTHNATSLILPGGANITTSNGDVAIFISEGAGNWRCIHYLEANGLTINQGTSNDKILSLKSTDVAHGMTTIVETDTFGDFRQFNAADAGGLEVSGYGELQIGLALNGYMTTGDSVKSSGALAAVHIDSFLKSGTSIAAAIGANNNILVVRNTGLARFILDADGDSHQDVGTAWTNFDTFDDVALLDALSVAVSKPGDQIKQSFGEFLKYNREALEKAKLVTFNEDGHHFVNMSKLTMALTGAVRQIGHAWKQAEDRLAAIEARMLALEAKP